MNSNMLADWARRNGYRPSSGGRLHKRTERGSVSLELKPLSLVMIIDTPGTRLPRVRTRLYKDLNFDPASGDVVLPDL